MLENGFQNDKLSFLFNENVNAKIAIKTATGTKKTMLISKVNIQETVWGSLFCTIIIDKLGK